MKRSIYLFFILSAIFIGVSLVFAQSSGGSSVMIYSYGQKGTDAETVSHLVGNEIGKGLFKYPCVDQMDDQTLAALLDWERKQDLLGKELDEQTLKDMAGAVGARYIVTVKSVTLPNGTIYTSVHIVDGKTGKLISARDMPPTNANEASRASDALVKQVMQDFDNLFKNQCEVHWTGSINYSELIQTSKTENWEGFSGGAGYKARINRLTTENLEETANILLQAMTLGSSGDSTKARVIQNFHYRWERITRETGTIPCREPGRNAFLKQVTGDEKEIRDKNGNSTEIVSVTISIRQDGKYQIKVYKIAEMKTKEKFERSGNIMGCKPNPFSSVSETEGLAGVGYIDLEGQVDPKDPDVLTGKKVTGTLETRQYTIEWNLRRVKPNQKKALK